MVINGINGKRKIIILGTVIIMALLLGITYAWFNYRQEGTNKKVVVGNIYLTLAEGQEEIDLENVFPMTTEEARDDNNDNYMTFSIDGVNTTGNDLYYEIKLNYGSNITGYTDRFRDSELVFDLVELDSNDNEVNYLVNARSYDNISNGIRIWVNTIDHSTSTEIHRKYKLRMWLSDDILISDTDPNATYPATGAGAYKNYYASVKLSVYGDFVEKEVHDAYSTIVKNVKNDTINFGAISSDNNGKGVYLLQGPETNNYPIYYYRGAADNNVIFGGFCWQMLRTTEAGGIKMVYNGEVTGNGETCTNTTHATRVLASGSVFNSYENSMSDVGYMYNTRYPYQSSSLTSGAYFGSDVSYENGVYSLTGTPVTTIDSSHHYTCNNTSATATCSTVRYYYYFETDSNNRKYINLTDGEKIEDAVYKMTGNGTNEVKARNYDYQLNTNDSAIKTAIETWFRTNLTNEVDNTKTDYREYLEDTVFCYDRSFQTTGDNTYLKSGWNPNVDGTSGNGDLLTGPFFGVRTRWHNSGWYSVANRPVLTCPNETDRFSVSNTKAHLNYPVGLLTTDEVVLAGERGNSATTSHNHYLVTGGTYWIGSPSAVGYDNVSTFYMKASASLDYSSVFSHNYNLRPVIALKSGVEFESGGEGTDTNPYVVKINS